MSADYADFRKMRFDRPHPRVLRITFDNGPMNAADRDLHREMAQIWPVVDRDRTVNAVILTGAGRVFSAGGDLSQQRNPTNDFELRARSWREARDIVYNMINCGKPIVSAIRGAAVGAGLACALMADIPIATRDARLLDGHARIGVPAGDHAMIIWPLLCGMAKSKYYLLMRKTLTGEEAERIGVVALAVDDDALDATALETAVELAEGPQTATRWTKYALNNWLRSAGPIFDTSLALEFLAFTGPEAMEGRTAFMEKRRPRFPEDSEL